MIVLAISRRRAYIAAGLVFLVALLPVLGLTPFVFQKYSTVADRYAYLALLGPAVALAWGLAGFDPRKWLLPLAILGIVLVAITVRQTIFWHDTLALFSHALEVNPTSLAATRSLGFYWADQHDDVQAAGYFEMASQMHPEDSTNHFNYANLLRRHGLLDQAIAHYQQAIAIDRTNASYDLNYGVALAMANRNEDALAAFQASAMIDPSNPDAWQNAGLVLDKLSRPDEARQAFEMALKLDRSRAVARQHLDRLSTHP